MLRPVADVSYLRSTAEVGKVALANGCKPSGVRAVSMSDAERVTRRRVVNGLDRSEVLCCCWVLIDVIPEMGSPTPAGR